jgi:amino acid transporter
VFFIFWGGYKVAMKTKSIPSQHVDLVTGLREIDAEEERYLAEEKARGPRSFWRKLWDGM